MLEFLQVSSQEQHTSRQKQMLRTKDVSYCIPAGIGTLPSASSKGWKWPQVATKSIQAPRQNQGRPQIRDCFKSCFFSITCDSWVTLRFSLNQFKKADASGISNSSKSRSKSSMSSGSRHQRQ
mmetsp:Transcript_23536/g.45719  ORF Transcript_23536/g.45719 Transcript_23536/m.45719 type:complete len:123 (-) Transcript_23536:161-529(-)